MINDSSSPAHYLEVLKQLVLKELKNEPVSVMLFGSRARGDFREGSDVDIALLPRGHFSPIKLSNLKERIEESTIPYKVDIVNMKEASPEFRAQILKEAIRWKD